MIVRKSLKTFACVALLGSVLFSGQLAASPVYAAELQTNAVSVNALRTLTVTGYGEVTFQPDIAYIQLGLHTTAKTAREAQDKNAKQFKTIYDALMKRNVSARDIQTTRFSTMPDYSWDNNKQELKGYQVEQIIQVKYRNLEDIGPLMDAATAAGANRIDSVSFSSEKIEAYRMDAMDKAIDNARLKAERIAKRAGVTLKETIQVTDGTAPSLPIPMYNQFGSSAADSSPKEGKAESSSQVYPGELKVGSIVTLTYSY